MSTGFSISTVRESDVFVSEARLKLAGAWQCVRTPPPDQACPYLLARIKAKQPHYYFLRFKSSIYVDSRVGQQVYNPPRIRYNVNKTESQLNISISMHNWIIKECTDKCNRPPTRFLISSQYFKENDNYYCECDSSFDSYAHWYYTDYALTWILSVLVAKVTLHPVKDRYWSQFV